VKASIAIRIIDDERPERREHFQVLLSGPEVTACLDFYLSVCKSCFFSGL